MESNALLRSGYAVAMRKGEQTNWEAYGKALKTILDAQHRLMHELKMFGDGPNPYAAQEGSRIPVRDIMSPEPQGGTKHEKAQTQLPPDAWSMLGGQFRPEPKDKLFEEFERAVVKALTTGHSGVRVHIEPIDPEPTQAPKPTTEAIKGARPLATSDWGMGEEAKTDAMERAGEVWKPRKIAENELVNHQRIADGQITTERSGIPVSPVSAAHAIPAVPTGSPGNVGNEKPNGLCKGCQGCQNPSKVPENTGFDQEKQEKGLDASQPRARETVLRPSGPDDDSRGYISTFPTNIWALERLAEEMRSDSAFDEMCGPSRLGPQISAAQLEVAGAVSKLAWLLRGVD